MDKVRVFSQFLNELIIPETRVSVFCQRALSKYMANGNSHLTLLTVPRGLHWTMGLTSG